MLWSANEHGKMIGNILNTQSDRDICVKYSFIYSDLIKKIHSMFICFICAKHICIQASNGAQNRMEMQIRKTCRIYQNLTNRDHFINRLSHWIPLVFRSSREQSRKNHPQTPFGAVFYLFRFDLFRFDRRPNDKIRFCGRWMRSHDF